MSITTAQNVTDIVSVADALGIDPNLALATAFKESGLNPYAQGDPVSGLPTSFGDFQLHQGGELGSLSPAQAYDPFTNAGVALSQFAAVKAADPSLSGGALAAAAQNPSHPTAYAADVNANYAAITSAAGEPPAPSSSGFGGWLSKVLHSLAGGAGLAAGIATGGATTGGTSPVVSAVEGLASGLASGWAKEALTIGLELVFVLGGLALLVLGAERMFPGVTRTITSAVTTGAKAAAA